MMNNRKNKLIHICLLAIIPISLFACSKKDNDAPDDTSKGSGMSMKIDGKVWDSSINNLYTSFHEVSQFEDYYLIAFGGKRSDIEGSENDVSDLTMFISIPKSRFNNPKGTYLLVGDFGLDVDQGTATFTKRTNEGSTSYKSHNPANPTQSVGSVEITDFEIGPQTMVGHLTGTEGYMKLSGTFKLDMYSAQENPASTMKITEGKFNLNSVMGFNF